MQGVSVPPLEKRLAARATGARGRFGQWGVARVSAYRYLALSGLEDAWLCLEGVAGWLCSGGRAACAAAGALNGVLEAILVHMNPLFCRRG